MDGCPVAFVRTKKTLPDHKKGILVVISGIAGCGKTTLAKTLQSKPEPFLKHLAPIIWKDTQPDNFTPKVHIVEANDNMTTGSNQVANYNRGRLISAHTDKQNELRSKLEQKYMCILSNCSLDPAHLRDYINSPKLIKIDGVEGKVWELVHIIVIKLLPVEFPFVRNISESDRSKLFEAYKKYPFFDSKATMVFAGISQNVTQLHQTYFEQVSSRLLYNTNFDRKFICQNRMESNQLPFKLMDPIKLLALDIGKSTLIENLPVELLQLINMYLAIKAEMTKENYHFDNALFLL